MVDPISYQPMVGSLLYAAIATRPDIAQAVGAVSKFNSCPTEAHLTAVKRILHCLNRTINLGLRRDQQMITQLDSQTPIGPRHGQPTFYSHCNIPTVILSGSVVIVN